MDKESVSHYALLLHQWTLAILRTLEDDTFYSFTLSDDHVEAAKFFKSTLLASAPAPAPPSPAAVEAFHDFIKFILFPQEQIPTASSKWEEPIECLFALTALQPGGIFKEAHNITQMFAQTSYHIRGAILFEGYRLQEEFEGNLYK